MKTITTHCALRLGDNLAHMHFLRKLAAANPGHLFEHYVQAEYMRELALLTEGGAITLRSLPALDHAGRWLVRPKVPSIDAWKNTGSRYEHADPATRNNYARFMLDWFEILARRMGLRSPLSTSRDLLFDYPALQNDEPQGEGVKPLDFLVVNSRPLSGQAFEYKPEEMDRLILELQGRGYSVIATNRSLAGAGFAATEDWHWTVTQIGKLSQRCRRILMVSTGPSWPTFNIWNRKTIDLRVIINGIESVDLDPDAIHVRHVSDMRSVLRAKELL
jgi:hypothetical protein